MLECNSAVCVSLILTAGYQYTHLPWPVRPVACNTATPIQRFPDYHLLLGGYVSLWPHAGASQRAFLKRAPGLFPNMPGARLELEITQDACEVCRCHCPGFPNDAQASADTHQPVRVQPMLPGISNKPPCMHPVQSTLLRLSRVSLFQVVLNHVMWLCS